MMNDLLAIAGIIPVFEFVSTHGAVEQADRWGIADTIRSQQADDTHLEHAHNEAAAAAAATAAAVATESSTIERKQHRSSPPTIGSSHERFDGDQVRRKALREANRVHCRETRERKRDAERLLREEVEILTLYKAIVDDGPDLFSLHTADLDAPFSFLCHNFYRQLNLMPDDIVGLPLASIVDPRDAQELRIAVFRTLQSVDGGSCGYGDNGAASSGILIRLRVVCRGISCQASMTIVVGTQGLVVVTRLYDL